MPEYAKKTVAELQEILKSRNLPSSGKKAELVARLNEADKQAESQSTEKVEAESTSIPAPASAETPEPSVAKETTPTTTAANGAAQSGDGSAETAEGTTTLESKTYALNLASSDVNDELAKRKARAARFGTGGDANDDSEAAETVPAESEALRNLERAKRFGTGQTAIGKLDQALSSEPQRKRKGAPGDESGVMDDPGLKRGFGRRGRGGLKHRGRGGQGSKPTGVSKNHGAYTSDKDREAAEARKKRFASS